MKVAPLPVVKVYIPKSESDRADIWEHAQRGRILLASLVLAVRITILMRNIPLECHERRYLSTTTGQSNSNHKQATVPHKRIPPYRHLVI